MTLFANCLRGRLRGTNSGSRSVFPAFSTFCTVAGLGLILSAGLAHAAPPPATGKKPTPKKDDCGKKGGKNSRAVDLAMLPAAPGKAAAKWSCEVETLELAPVWQGEKLTCGFSIKNDGGGILNIRASAG